MATWEIKRNPKIHMYDLVHASLETKPFYREAGAVGDGGGEDRTTLLVLIAFYLL